MVERLWSCDNTLYNAEWVEFNHIMLEGTDNQPRGGWMCCKHYFNILLLIAFFCVVFHVTRYTK